MSGSRQPPYFLLTLLFLFLSLVGIGLIGLTTTESGFSLTSIPLLDRLNPTPSLPPPSPTLEPTSTPTPLPQIETDLILAPSSASPSASPSPLLTSLPTPSTTSAQISLSPTPKLSLTPILTISPTSKLSPTPTPPPSASPTPASRVYSASADSFTVTYSSSRKVYEDKEKGTINRYTFYRSDSSFAVHVGPTWSWTHPDRVFDKNALLSGYPTFRYQADGQILVDLETPAKKITLQCIHNGNDEIKSECQKFVTSFKFSPAP